MEVFLTGIVVCEHPGFTWFSPIFFLFTYTRRAEYSWLPHGYKSETEVLEKGGLRHIYLGSVAYNRTLINIHFPLFRESYTGHLPALRCVKMTSDHLDLFRLCAWGSEASIPLPVLQTETCFHWIIKEVIKIETLFFFLQEYIINFYYIHKQEH